MTKREGGYYIGVDGKPHDAMGRPIIEEVPPAPETIPVTTTEPASEAGVIPLEEAVETVKKVAAGGRGKKAKPA